MAALMTGCGVNTNNGDGSRTGQFVALHKKGLFVKTWEAELIKGGMSGGSGSFGVAPFWVTVPENMAAQVQSNLDNSTEVEIKYHTAGIYSLFSSDSDGDFLLTIEPAKRAQQ